jgi:hypothetical protein
MVFIDSASGASLMPRSVICVKAVEWSTALTSAGAAPGVSKMWPNVSPPLRIWPSPDLGSR